MTANSTALPAVASARRGLLVVGILLIAANLRASLTTVTPLLGAVRTYLNLSAPVASALISVPLMAFAAFSPVAPRIAAKFGIERTLGLSLAVLALGIMIRSLPWISCLWIGTVGLGISIATLNVVLPALVKRDFRHEVGRLTGGYTAMQGAAGAVASGVAVPLAGAGASGWRLAFGVWAGLAIIALAAFIPRLYSRAGIGFGAAPATIVAVPRSPWRSATAWQATIFMGMQSGIYYTALTWWPAIDAAHGIAAASAGLHQVVLQGLTVAGSLLTGVVLHRRTKDQRAVAVILSAFMAAGAGGELLVAALSPLWLGLIGFGAGGSLVLVLSLFGFRTADHHQAAALSGMAQSVGYLLSAMGPVVAGILYERTANWSIPLVILLCAAIVQGVSGYLAGRDRLV